MILCYIAEKLDITNMTGNTIGLIKEKPLLERIKDLEIDNEKLFNIINEQKMDIDKLYKTIGIICTSGILNDK
mgnify:CR=1 FL=1